MIKIKQKKNQKIIKRKKIYELLTFKFIEFNFFRALCVQTSRPMFQNFFTPPPPFFDFFFTFSKRETAHYWQFICD